MKPTTVRDLLLSLGLAAGIGAALNGCSTQEAPSSKGDGGTGGSGAGGYPPFSNNAGLAGRGMGGAGGEMTTGFGGNRLVGVGGQAGEQSDAGGDVTGPTGDSADALSTDATGDGR